jgi:hypothetical protein
LKAGKANCLYLAVEEKKKKMNLRKIICEDLKLYKTLARPALIRQ